MKSLVAVTLTLLITGACLAQKHSALNNTSAAVETLRLSRRWVRHNAARADNSQNDGGRSPYPCLHGPPGRRNNFQFRAVHRLMDCETTLADLWDKADDNKDPEEPVIRGTLNRWNSPACVDWSMKPVHPRSATCIASTAATKSFTSSALDTKASGLRTWTGSLTHFRW